VKRLFYISGTTFFLTLTVVFGLQIAGRPAESKPPSGTPFILWSGSEVMKSNGDIWHMNMPGTVDPGSWSLSIAGSSLPLPASDIAFFDHTTGSAGNYVLVSKTGEGWWYCGCSAPDSRDGWRPTGILP
jgi:hypothetical protein